MFDVVVVGAGPSGFSAAIYLAKAKFSVLVLGIHSKSKLFKAPMIHNLFGFRDGIEGKKLLENGIEQAKSFGAQCIEEEVINVKRKDDFFAVKTDSLKEFEAKNVVLASGLSYKPSGIKNEETLVGKGVHYCVMCDGFFYAEKNVCVVGNGNYAAEEALQLLSYTKNISIFSNGGSFAFSDELKKSISDNKIVLRNEKILEFVKAENGIELHFENSKSELFDGAFMALGNAGAFSFAQNLGLELNGNAIKVDSEGKTNVKGVYAVGDCTGALSQVSFAAGMACNVAFTIIKSSAGKKVYVDYG